MSAPLSFTAHPRHRDGSRYVYAVLSRRAGGISVGINLNPDQACNFDCVYCQVERDGKGERSVDAGVLESELCRTLEEIRSGALVRRCIADGLPPPLARVVEVAIAGDGEPTASLQFAGAVRQITQLMATHGVELPLVLFTNATSFHRPRVREGLDALVTAGGRVLAKLDAGTEAAYRKIDRSAVRFDRVLDNLRDQAARAPLWIQSMFVELDGVAPTAAEIDAYVEQLRGLAAPQGQLAGVEVGTIARPPAVAGVRALDVAQLQEIARRVVDAIPDVPVQIVPPASAPTPVI